jgi:CRP/FNR family transcriptional regulator
MHSPQTTRLLAAYPALAGQQDIVTHLPFHEVPAGTPLFYDGDACQGFPMVLRGEVKVSRGSASGRELELYRVQAGEMCLVSSASLFAGQSLTARGVTTTPTELVLLPPLAFREAMAHQPFRDFVLGLFAARMADLTGLIESVAFQRLDCRLAGTLLGHGTLVHTTHQALADELGTVREIVTRLLRRFEREGLVELSRECITVVDVNGLRTLAAGEPMRTNNRLPANIVVQPGSV